MCGIAGLFDPNCTEPEARARLGRMLALIAHRGPDGEGTHFAPALSFAMGMRRLSIIDLEGGRQPIWNEDESIGVTFNGEIYNYVELRAELIAAGHQFRTHSDTEVLVHLYEEHGDAMMDKLRGMFAFAILDQRRRRLLLARDHFGQKPLYYAQTGAALAWASELKCLLTLPWISREHDPNALLDYVAWLSLPAPRTHFRAIHKLPAGCCLTLPLDARSAEADVRKYWSYQIDPAPGLRALDPAVEELDATLRDSVRVHLRADVPVGVLLSSGLDSRAVVAYAQELQASGMQTFTVGFGAADSELQGAAETAREIGSKHHELELTAEDFASGLERVAWHLDEPVGDPAAFAVLKVCELARGHVKVLLSGEGSDELFAGYEGRYLGMLDTLSRSEKLRPFAPMLPAGDPAGTSRWQRLFARAHHSRGSEIAALRMEGLPGNVRSPRGLSAAQMRQLRERTGVIAEQVHRPQRDVLSELLAFDLDWQLAESLLQKADKMSMGASIELRTPILDLRVAELGARLDSSLKLPPGGPGKLVLRHCLARRLNEPLRRPKKGFPVPLAEWFAGPLRTRVETALFSPSASIRELLDTTLLRRAWDDFLAGAWDGGRAFYSLWLYETWRAGLTKIQPA